MRIFTIISLLFFLFLLFPTKIIALYLKYAANPILSPGSITSWDSLNVYDPSILYDDSIYKMWYTGTDGIKVQIGYSESTDAINFTKYSNNPLIHWDFVSNTDIGVGQPTIIKRNGKYEMWFNNAEANLQNFHIFYTSSINGINWSIPIPILFDLTTTSWDSQGMGNPHVIFSDQENIYQIWYVARGSYNNITRWRIGFGSSTDGINWIKNPFPVIDGTFNWENGDIGSPSVIFDNQTYNIWYAGGKAIGYANSNNGINWNKNTDPILSPGSSLFEVNRVSGPFVIKKNLDYYIYYTGWDSSNRYSIGLATSESLPSPLPTTTPTTAPTPSVTPVASFTPTPTPTTTPTLTPTLSPTSTPTPTPTMTITPSLTPSPTPTLTQAFSPIIIIPGLGASWNPKDIFSCSLDTSGKWELAPYVSLYNRLINTLTTNAGLKLNQDVYVYTYDWRQPLDKQADRFKNYLDNIRISRPGDTRFRIIGHSLGGLIIRSYLTSYPVDQHIISVLSVGTPHFGTPLAYPLWENGKVDIDDLVMQIAISQVINHCRVIRTFIPPKINVLTYKFRSAREIVQYLVPIVRQLLPVFDYLRQNGNIKPSNQLVYQNDWVSKNPFPQDKFHIPFVTLSGSDFPTLRYIDVINPSIREKAFGEWLDGKPVGNGKINEGDGTILDISSQLEAAENVLIPGNHSDIISNNTGISKILDFLGLADIPLAPAVVPPEQISQNALTVSLSGDAQVKVTDPRGKLLEAKEDIFVSFDPAVGLYRLEVLPGKTSDAYLHLAEIVKREDPQTQSIPLHLTKNRPSRFYLIYNPLTSSHLQLIPL